MRARSPAGPCRAPSTRCSSCATTRWLSASAPRRATSRPSRGRATPRHCAPGSARWSTPPAMPNTRSTLACSWNPWWCRGDARWPAASTCKPPRYTRRMADNVTKLAPVPSRPSVIQLVFREKGALYAAYMPMLSEGGLFVPTTREYKLGEDIYLLLSLPDDTQRYPVAGKVAWITPANASGGRTQGVGVRFPTDEKTRA